uniref:NADH-ubiquinone oxidoreductase chain 4L n=1 Tax=Tetraclita japonica TaxID=240496 RepID=Q6L8D3_9CRUS|nr:NADH dehydrogenase subunit 4L [Tetraclita japonica]QDL00104.1 NADH dehydrogenase subunit 4L [Tetraclita japonica]QOQ85755.1 NADH dehydrogenase subunit 4l [Tetraclita japonica]BAD20522.1 NADH dehydrogenase subunit 4L [Tetraclita japonica]
MIFYYTLPMFMFLVGFWMYVSKRKHLMNMLISLEYIVLSVFLFIMMVTFIMGLETYLSLIFLVASVCEGSLGVGIMVGMVRSHGSDYISSFSVLKC